MKHKASSEDIEFRYNFEAGVFRPEEFDHKAHLRLAYIYLCESNPDIAHIKMRQALLNFLLHHGIDSSKYHETMTKAWVLAVRHFMELSAESDSATSFMNCNHRLFEKGIMFTHYSEATLFSGEAKKVFVKPDKDSIPRYN